MRHAAGMFCAVKIEIPDDLLKGVVLTSTEAVLDFAVGLFTDGRITLGRAARIASMNQSDFLKELGRRRVPVHYTMGDLEADLRVVREIPPP